MSQRIGLGFDVHPFGGTGSLVLGGVEIEGPGLAGHSDADVIAHAVADALLGGAALPDLGTMFPASDDRYRGASSIALLETVAKEVAAASWRLVNVVVVLAVEQPPVAPHLPAMRAALGAALRPLAASGGDESGLPVVQITPKRAEGLGAIGRGEGIAAWAVTLLETE